MSLAIKYERVEDANMRLRHTLVLYKDQPVYITSITRGAGKDDILRVLYSELPFVGKRARFDPDDLEDAKRKFISSKHFDIAPFKLGYVNKPTGTGAFYTSRMPNRIQKQGLCGENFLGKDNYGQSVDFNTFLSCTETLEMIAGKYPSFAVARAATEKVQAVAFSREFCVVKDEVLPDLIYLYHKGGKVGRCQDLGANVSLPKKFECLRESLSELGVRVTIV